MTIEELYNLYRQHPSVQTDTRKIKQGDIFFALKGPNFNGNAFAKQAIESGATYAVVDEKEYADEKKIFWFEDALEALQDLAKFHRLHFEIPFIAITGSNGKTTTKELIHTVLSSTYKTYTTLGNLNNHIGVPLTILSIHADAEMAVIEMGANHLNEIKEYCIYAQPTHGLITNCGKAHLEGFGGIEGVKKGKGELFDFLRDNKGTAFVMWDYDYLRDMSKGIPHIFKYGTKDADVEGKIITSEPYLQVGITKGASLNIKTQLVGDYNYSNVLAAVTIGVYLKVPPEKIRKAIEDYAPSNSRSQLIEKDGKHIILDAYNANPSSMKAAIENFAKLHAGKKVLLLGAMAELGAESMDEHKQLVDLISQYNWNEVVLVGGDFLKIDHPFKQFNNSVEAGGWLKRQSFPDAYFLIKGSRSMQMEKVLE